MCSPVSSRSPSTCSCSTWPRSSDAANARQPQKACSTASESMLSWFGGAQATTCTSEPSSSTTVPSAPTAEIGNSSPAARTSSRCRRRRPS